MNNENKSYILSYCIRDTTNDVWTYDDHWSVYEDIESAQEQYELLLERNDLHIAFISETIVGTDI